MASNDKDIKSLIPLYVSGQLEGADRLLVERAAASDPDVSSEIEFYRSISDAVKTASEDHSPGELGWARLSKAIGEEAQSATPAPQAEPSWRGWKYVAAAMAVVAAGQAAVLTLPQAAMVADNGELYVPVSEEVSAFELQVIFQGSATAEQIQIALTEANGSISSGPSAIGLYRVSFKSQDAADAAKASFEANPALIADVR